MQTEPVVSTANRYLPALTGLRAVAAYLVFVHHYNPASDAPNSFINRLFAQGYIGVTVFFVLSGFLIYHRYADAYVRQTNWSWRRYLQNRFARIFPLYALLLLLTAGVDIARGQPMNWLVFSLNLSLLKGFFENYTFSGIAQSWSLTVEECFYVAAPLLFVGLNRWGAFWLTVGLVSIGLLLWATVGQLAGHGLLGSLPFVLFYTFFGRAFEFVAGMWLARRWHQNQLPTVHQSMSIGFLLILSCVLWQASVPNFIVNPTGLVASEVVAYNTVLPVGIGLCLWGLLREKSYFRRFLSYPIMQTLGRSSYAFYLIHIGVIASLLRKLGLTNHWLLMIALMLIAYGLYVAVEKPLQRWLYVR